MAEPTGPQRITVANFQDLEQWLFEIAESDRFEGVFHYEGTSDNRLLHMYVDKGGDRLEYMVEGGAQGVMKTCIEEMLHRDYIDVVQTAGASSRSLPVVLAMRGVFVNAAAIRARKEELNRSARKEKAENRRWWTEWLIRVLLLVIGAVLGAWLGRLFHYDRADGPPPPVTTTATTRSS